MSIAFENRFSGSFSKALKNRSSSTCGAFGKKVRMGGGVAITCSLRMNSSLLPSIENGVRPVSIS
jgi:hypothetical protein